MKQQPARQLRLMIGQGNRKYALTKGQLEALLNEQKRLIGLLDKLLDEREKMAFLLAQSRLQKLGITKMSEYPN